MPWLGEGASKKQQGGRMKKSRGLVGVAVLVVVVSLVLLGFSGLYGYLNNVRNTTINLETSLNAQYEDNQNELSNYVSSFYEKFRLAKFKSEKLNQILTDAIKGRYDKEGAGFGKGSPFFSAIVEAYPNLAELSVFDKIVDYVSAGREAFKNKQSKLLDQLRGYENWRKEGLLQNLVIEKAVGYPALKARVGKNYVSGAEALEQMHQIVLASEAKKAFESGTMDPLKTE